ncbi:MAG: hypothetical protein LBI45_06700 [Bacteroidales bacterium]|jgi:hypothetical protein|nr:hypothetical protein [Bacteroidales bacterium]
MSRKEIIKNLKNAHKLSYPIRLETGINWLHFDVYNDLTSRKIVEFKV